jgi:hypothetical protein
MRSLGIEPLLKKHGCWRHEKAHRRGGLFLCRLWRRTSVPVTAHGELIRIATGTYGKHEARLGGLRCNRSNLIRTGDVEPREDAQSDHFCA